MTSYPASVDSFTTGGATDPTNNPSLPEWAEKISDAVVELQKKLGTGASTPVAGQVPVGQSGGGSLWQEFVPIPSGLISIWSGTVATIPSGWVLCDGTNGTPDLRDRFIAGAGSTYAVGATGGAANVSLTTAQLPSHTHTGNSSNDGGHAHTSGNLSGDSHSHGSGNLLGGNHTHGSGNFVNNHTHSGANLNTGSNSHNHTGIIGAASNTGNTYSVHTAGNSFSNFMSNMITGGAHTHNVTGNTGGSNASATNGTSAASTVGISGNTLGSGVGISGNTSNTGAHSHTVTIGSTGSGSAHENRPPYYALAFIMKL